LKAGQGLSGSYGVLTPLIKLFLEGALVGEIEGKFEAEKTK